MERAGKGVKFDQAYSYGNRLSLTITRFIQQKFHCYVHIFLTSFEKSHSKLIRYNLLFILLKRFRKRKARCKLIYVYIFYASFTDLFIH